MVRKVRLFCLILALLLLTGCTMAPKAKTIMLVEAEEENEPAVETSHEMKRTVQVPLDKIDPNGLHPDLKRAVKSFSDNERLFVMSVRLNSLSTDQLPEGSVEQQTERVLTQFGTLNYQYGFFDPVLALSDVSAECFDVSSDGKYVACIAGNTLYVYRLSDGALVQSQSRDLLLGRVTFGKDSAVLYFGTGGESKRLEALNVEDGSLRTVVEGKSYRELVTDNSTHLLTVVSQGTEEISLLKNGTIYEGLLSGSRSGGAELLPDGMALLQYGSDLFCISDMGAVLLMPSCSAFAVSPDGGTIAYALNNADGTVDVCIAAWQDGTVNDSVVAYKNVGLNVSTLLMPEDGSRIYVQGTDKNGAASALVIEFQ